MIPVPGEIVADDAQTRAERLVGAMRARDGFSAWLGVEVVALAPAACTVRATVRREMLNGFGVCHGGVTFRWLTARWRSRRTRMGACR
jgi:acyl-CoA thioesterase